LVTDTIMRDLESKARLAHAVLNFACSLTQPALPLSPHLHISDIAT
jgi:hypothetical protein